MEADWTEAVERAARARRVAVLGATDAGKSWFVAALAAVRPGVRLVDVDPGQKMVGPPGSASLGWLLPQPKLERFVFLGSTAVGSFRALAGVTAELARGAEPFVVNGPGYVTGPGAALQAMLVAAADPDLIVAIGAKVEGIVARFADVPVVRIERSPLARRKSPAMRRAVRQAAFAAALAGARQAPLPAGIALEPGPPLPLEGPARPVCCLADEAGEDMALGILLGPDAVLAPPTPWPAARLRLGAMWAEPRAEGWVLLERLAPAFTAGSSRV